MRNLKASFNFEEDLHANIYKIESRIIMSSRRRGQAQQATARNQDRPNINLLRSRSSSNDVNIQHRTLFLRHLRLVLKWSCFGLLFAFYVQSMFQSMELPDEVMIEYFDKHNETNLGSRVRKLVKNDGTEIAKYFSPLQIVVMQNEHTRRNIELKSRDRDKKRRIRTVEDQKKRNEAHNRTNQTLIEMQGKNEQYSRSIQLSSKIQNNVKKNALSDQKSSNNIHKSNLLTRIGSLWSIVLCCLVLYRILNHRRFFQRLGINPSPVAPFPGRRANARGNLINSLRRARFDALVMRLNEERIRNGARPISGEALLPAFSTRDFTGNDYDQLLRLNEENGNVIDFDAGATEEEINRNPTHKMTSNSLACLKPDQKRCAICLESYVINDVVRTLPCFHQFHSHCIDKWSCTKATCPICKHNSIG